VRHQQGRLIGRLESLGFSLRSEAELKMLTLDVLKTSEIEGEILDAGQVRSSVARRLGLDIGGLERVDWQVEGIVEMTLEATHRYQEPLTIERLFDWHAALFPTGRSGMTRISVGAWRKDRLGPMQVVSGPVGRERVHFEAPESSRLDGEVQRFLEWVEDDAELDLVLKAGLAHLWFLTIHPFDDGNGRVARAITDLLLARSEQSSHRFYSMSSQIRRQRTEYYRILEKTQRGNLDVTDWLEWFLACLSRALEGAQETLGSILHKAEIWERLRPAAINSRQKQMLNRILDREFKGKLTTSKWATLTRCSQDTAHRDISELMELGILAKNPGGGRSTSYSLADIPKNFP